MKKWLLAFMVSSSLFCYADDNTSHNTLSVHGEGIIKVKATIADIAMGIEVSESNSSKAQQTLAKKQSDVLAALKANGAEKIEATSFSLYPLYDKDKQTVVIGYKARLTITFTSTVDKAGSLIDVSLQAGANQNLGVTARARDEELSTARKQALKIACTKALDEGKLVLHNLELEYKGIEKVDVTPLNGGVVVYPTTRTRYYAAKETSTVEVTEEELSVTASVALILNYQPGTEVMKK